MLYVYRFLWPLRLGWLLVCCLYKEVYLQFFNVCPFDYTAVAGSGKVGPVNQVNHASWVAIITSTDRPKSVRNRSVIELFCGVVFVVIVPFWHFCWFRGFCHRTESDLFLFLLLICTICAFRVLIPYQWSLVTQGYIKKFKSDAPNIPK